MNIIRKIWCRTFQTVFRIALPVLPYSEPKLLSGVEEAAGLFVDKKIPKVLIVTDASIAKLGLVKPLTDALDIPLHIGEIRADDIPAMARHADRECNPLYPVPKLMDAKALEMMYYKVSGKECPAAARTANVSCQTAQQHR